MSKKKDKHHQRDSENHPAKQQSDQHGQANEKASFPNDRAPGTIVVVPPVIPRDDPGIERTKLSEGAFAKCDFSRRFLLDEERLRKLVSIITNRLQEADIAAHLFLQVYRSDGLQFTTPSIDLVLAEDNNSHERIVRTSGVLSR
jgi:hypothetical protein